MMLMGKDTLNVLEARFDLKNNIGIFPDAGDLQGKVLRESRAGHLMVPLLPDSSLFRGTIVLFDACVRKTVLPVNKTLK